MAKSLHRECFQDRTSLAAKGNFMKLRSITLVALAAIAGACSEDVRENSEEGQSKLANATWTKCAAEYEQCSFVGTRNVRFGLDGVFVSKELTGGTPCSREVFGDPVVGKLKQCDIEDLATPVPAPAGGGANAPGQPMAGPTTTVKLEPYDKAFKNPMMGFRNDSVGDFHRYGTLSRQYIRWNEIENKDSDTIETIKSFSERTWQGLPEKNIKVIPRVYLDFPGVGTYWPSDLATNDYDSPDFHRRMVRLIERLGQVWDNDPRVAFVESGIIGKWGEQHSPSPSAALQKEMGDAYQRAFKNKLVVNRYAGSFSSYGFGIYWDSFGTNENQAMTALGDRWKTNVFEGEIAYDCCRPAGSSAVEDLSNAGNFNRVAGLVREFHTTGLGWISSAPYDGSTAAGIDTLQKTFGYRLLIDEATFTSKAEPGGRLSLSMNVRNVGSAPFYYAWPVEVSLLSKATREVIWAGKVDGIDVRTFQPGEGWDANKSAYSKPAGVVTAAGSVTLPASLQPGAYTLAVSVLDLAGNRPSLRFAVKNYYKGGRHPLGSVVIGAAAVDENIGTLDDLQADDSIAYPKP